MKDALQVALKAVDDKKGHDIAVLDISEIASFANYFVICTGDSSRQIQAIADEVELKLRNEGLRPNHIEGYRNAEWVLLDYVDMVVHVFSKSARTFYDLERLWRDGKRLEPERLLEAGGKPAAAKKAPRRKSRPPQG
jgi:ribosome-associated protein